MEIFGLLFYVIIFVAIIRAKKAAQSGNNHGRSHNLPNVPKSKRTIVPNTHKNGRTIVPNIPMKKKIEKNFMEPHEEEKIQPRIRTNNLWGEDEYAHQRIVALRLMEGDPIPAGYVRIKCPYCNADNLVTKDCKQYHSCYFCRVPID